MDALNAGQPVSQIPLAIAPKPAVVVMGAGGLSLIAAGDQALLAEVPQSMPEVWTSLG